MAPVQRLRTGRSSEFFDSGGEASYLTAENKDSVSILKGQPVTPHPSGTGIIRASAADNTKNAIGLAFEDVAPGFSVRIITSGPFQMSDWTPVTGTVTLAALAIYYLGTDLGTLVTIPPDVPGAVNQFSARAVAPDILDISIEPAIVL